MRGLYFAFSVFVSLLGLGGFVAFDYFMLNKNARARGEDPISFITYASGWVSLASALSETGEGATATAAPMPEGLLAMLPRTPEGWSVAPALPDDAAAFLSPDSPAEERDLVADAATENAGRGLEQARQTYTQGARVVVIELVRYPDMIFTSFGAMALKMELQMKSDAISAQEFMVVRGLEVREARLSDAAPARVFLADVGGQIHLRVTASASMTDLDLLPFFETLHVPAMNADVVEKTTGLGEVPVIVVASVLTEETRRARAAEAERRAIEAADRKTQELLEEKAAREAEGAGSDTEAPQDGEDGAEEAPETGTSPEVKLRKGTEGSTPSLKPGSGKTGGFLDKSCRTENGRKVCGGGGD